MQIFMNTIGVVIGIISYLPNLINGDGCRIVCGNIETPICQFVSYVPSRSNSTRCPFDDVPGPQLYGACALGQRMDQFGTRIDYCKTYCYYDWDCARPRVDITEGGRCERGVCNYFFTSNALRYLESCLVRNERTGEIIFEDLTNCQRFGKRRCNRYVPSGTVMIQGISYALYPCEY